MVEKEEKILIRLAAFKVPLLVERDLGRGNTMATSVDLTPSQLATIWSPRYILTLLEDRGEDAVAAENLTPSPLLGRGVKILLRLAHQIISTSKTHLQSDSYRIFK